MKNIKALAMLLVSALLGLMAAAVAANWLQHKAIGASRVVVAVTDLDLGTRLNGQMLRAVDWPANSVPNGAFSKTDTLQDRVLRVSLARGEPVLASKLAPVGTKGGLSAVIDHGQRAITVRVNDVIGVAGFALPGNYVDVLVSTQGDATGDVDRGDRQVSKIVLQHILVLAVAQEASRNETSPKVVNAVTLEVTPEQAEKIDLARAIGTLSLVLRNQMDDTRVASRGVMKAQLLAGASAPAMPASQPRPVARAPRVVRRVRVTEPARTNCVEVVKNGISSVECF